MIPTHTPLPQGGRLSFHPVVFAALIAPFGATAGFVGVALGYEATKHGLSVTQTAAMIALGLTPHVWKVLWAPVGDTTLTRKKWYLLSVLICAAGMVALAAVPLGPSTLGLVDAVVLITSLATTFLGFATEGMIAHLTPDADRGRVGGWYQAGNLGGGGIGGGLGLWLLTKLPLGWETGAILAFLTLCCAAALLFVPPVPPEIRAMSVGAAVKHVAGEVWRTLRSRYGALTALLCIVPVGTGAASGVMGQAAVADHWHVGATQVELVQGFLSGLISMAACVLSGYWCARIGGRKAYIINGAIMAAMALTVALLPPTPLVYIVGNLAYSACTGLCFAAFTTFVLDTIGRTTAATKYNLFACFANTPIWYMGLLLAAVEVHWGPRNMLLAECGLGLLGILIFTLASRLTASRVRATAR